VDGLNARSMSVQRATSGRELPLNLQVPSGVTVNSILTAWFPTHPEIVAAVVRHPASQCMA
jgi:hypothetical protein